MGVASFRLTLHAYELAALISAARWVVDGAEGDLPDEARAQIRQLLAEYESQRARLTTRGPEA
jgi:hypothetical protein